MPRELKAEFLVKGKWQTVRAFRDFTRKMKLAMLRQSRLSANHIANDAISRAPHDTGYLVSQIGTKRIRRSSEWKGFVVASNAPYSAQVEFGSYQSPRAGRKIPMIQSGRPGGVAEYARRKTIPPFALAKFIMALKAKTGKRPFLGPAYVRERPAFYSAMQKILFFEIPREVSTHANLRSALT